MNFWHQIDEILELHPLSLLEIGKGGGVVSDHLKKSGVNITTLDNDAGTNPDIVGSIMRLPLKDKEFDMVLAAEVLEHVPYDEVPEALKELRRVAKKWVTVTLPYRGTRITISFKIPIIPYLSVFIPIPYFWRPHLLSASGHHWEVGKNGFSRARIRKMFQKEGLTVVKEKIFSDDYDHIFYILKV